MRVIANVYMKNCFENGFKIIRSKSFLWQKIIKQPLLLKIRDDMCFIQKGLTNNLIFFLNNRIFWWITLYKTRNYPLHTASVRSSPTAVKDVFTVSSSDDVTKKGRYSVARLFEMVYNKIKVYFDLRIDISKVSALLFPLRHVVLMDVISVTNYQIFSVNKKTMTISRTVRR